MRKILLTCLCIAILSAAFTNCKNNNKSYQTEEKDQITYVQADDQEMNDAIAKAKANFGKFEKALIENSKTNLYEGFIVKQGFATDDGGTEHMWITDITYQDKKLKGILGNTPTMGSTLKMGDKVVIDIKQISDWIYIETKTGEIHGGYTMQVLRKHMSAEEAEAFDNEWGTKFVDK